MSGSERSLCEVLHEVTLGGTITSEGNACLTNLAASLEVWNLQEASLYDVLEVMQAGLTLKLARDIDEGIHEKFQELQQEAMEIVEARRELVTKLKERQAEKEGTTNE